MIPPRFEINFYEKEIRLLKRDINEFDYESRVFYIVEIVNPTVFEVIDSFSSLVKKHGVIYNYISNTVGYYLNQFAEWSLGKFPSPTIIERLGFTLVSEAPRPKPTTAKDIRRFYYMLPNFIYRLNGYPKYDKEESFYFFFTRKKLFPRHVFVVDLSKKRLEFIEETTGLTPGELEEVGSYYSAIEYFKKRYGNFAQGRTFVNLLCIFFDRQSLLKAHIEALEGMETFDIIYDFIGYLTRLDDIIMKEYDRMRKGKSHFSG